MTELEQLYARQRDIIKYTCNVYGCGNCGLEWEDGGKKKCSMVELEMQIMELELLDTE